MAGMGYPVEIDDCWDYGYPYFPWHWGSSIYSPCDYWYWGWGGGLGWYYTYWGRPYSGGTGYGVDVGRLVEGAGTPELLPMIRTRRLVRPSRVMLSRATPRQDRKRQAGRTRALYPVCPHPDIQECRQAVPQADRLPAPPASTLAHRQAGIAAAAAISIPRFSMGRRGIECHIGAYCYTPLRALNGRAPLAPTKNPTLMTPCRRVYSCISFVSWFGL